MIGNFLNLKEKLHDIRFLLGPYYGKLPVLLVLFLLSSFIDLLSIGIIIPYLDIVMNGVGSEVALYLNEYSRDISEVIVESGGILIVSSAFIMLVFMLKCCFAIVINFKILDFCYGHGVYLKKSLLSSYQSLGFRDYLASEPSEYILGVTQLSSAFSQAYLQSLLRLTSEALIILLLLVAIGLLDTRLLLALLTVSAALFMIFYFIANSRMKSYGVNANIANSRLIQFISQAITGFREIRIFGIENVFYEKVSIEAERFKNATVKNQLFFTLPRYLIEVVFIVIIIVVVLVASFNDVAFVSLIPLLGAVAVAAMRILPSLNILINSIGQLFYLDNTVDKLAKMMRTEVSGVNVPSKFNRSINSNESVMRFDTLELVDVSFRYQCDSEDVINRLSLEVKAGDKIGLVGKSGSGKTTLLNIVIGLLDPTEGSILVNSRDYSSLRGYQKLFCYLPQDVFVVQGSLKDNITVFEKNVSDERLETAIEKARFRDVLQALDSDLEFEVKDNGSNLSGGQRQRIAIARAFYQERQILIFDESTSALDEENQSMIIDYLVSLGEDVTVLCVSHDTSVINKFEKAYSLVNGTLETIR